MEQNVLTDIQKKALAAIASKPKLSDFYLTGGTAGFFYEASRVRRKPSLKPDKQFIYLWQTAIISF